MENMLQNIEVSFCFPGEILIVSRSSIEYHTELFKNLFTKLDKKRFTFNISKYEFSGNKMSRLGFDTDDSTNQSASKYPLTKRNCRR